jgi:adenylate cyclase
MNDRLPRKLAAILYADVAGYSRLTGDDEDATHRTLSIYLDLITQTINTRNGKVMHFAGDAVLAKFDAVVDALSSATEIQEMLAIQNENLTDDRRVYFRIGINLGDVIEDRGDIYGDGVNIAARLESLANPGGICISEAVRSAIKDKLNVSYEEMGEQTLKNIEEPVRAFRVQSDTNSKIDSPSSSEKTESSPVDFSLPDRPSIAILPFKNLGSDQGHEFLADGIRLGIQASLVQLSGLFLINVRALNEYKNRDISANQAGDELGVNYVLDGAIQQAGQRVRATVHLTNVSTGQAIWAESYDRVIEDIFDLQDEITKEVVSSLNVKLLSKEAGRVWVKKLNNPEAHQYFYRGMSLMYEGNKDDNAAARDMFEKLYEVQPDSDMGPSNISVTHWIDGFFNWTDSQTDSYAQAEKWAIKATQYEDNNGLGHAVLGHLQLLKGHFEEALKTCSKGVEIRSSCPLAHGMLGLVLNYNGHARAAVRSVREALHLSRVYPPWMINFLAIAYRDCGDVAMSISAAKESLRINPEKNDAQLILCSDYKFSADHQRARDTAESFVDSNPSFKLASYAKSLPYKDSETLDRLIGALREAGLPE